MEKIGTEFLSIEYTDELTAILWYCKNPMLAKGLTDTWRRLNEPQFQAQVQHLGSTRGSGA
jgi:hypothetical protein